MAEIKLTTPLTKIRRIGETQKKALERLGLETVRDILYFFPTRYSHMSSVKTIRTANSGEIVTLYGIVKNPKVGKTFTSKIPLAQADLVDINNESIRLTWFHQAFIAKTIEAGESIKVTGKITENKGKKTMLNPEFERIQHLPIDVHDSLFQDKDKIEKFGYPIYPETRGITSKWIYHSIIKIFTSGILENIEDPLPEYIRKKYNLPSLVSSWLWLHSPKNEQQVSSAKKRFAFEEIFYIQIKNQQRKRQHQKARGYNIVVDPLSYQKFIKGFSFSPTQGQLDALSAIHKDFQKKYPMQRLLEGDVGSGKTFVAAVSAHSVINNRPKNSTGVRQDFGRLQVAYMAPTEVLATQLFENFIQYFKNTGIQIALLTGSGCRKFPSKIKSEEWTNISRSQVLKWIKNGEIPIVIGTHALIQKKVNFKDLALVIIDEQHRFGTRQRMQLTSKESRIPHYLSMSATPIPRTLALTIYGDLDLSIIDHMPQGRKTVITEIVAPTPEERERIYYNIRQQLNDGRQAYVICPRIDEADPNKARALQLKSVTTEAQRLSTHELKGYRIGVMHGKMTPKNKEEVMNQFYNHELDVLVSTSVIEVGVNVPNATNIVIEGAERFGLAQLHQLRGRVIRSEHQAFCYLFADAKTEKTIERMRAMQEAKNGFELAEMDLFMRGSGDLAGNKQWGMSDLAMEALKNIKLVEYARQEAKAIIEQDETLENFPELQDIIKRYDIHFE